METFPRGVLGTTARYHVAMGHSVVRGIVQTLPQHMVVPRAWGSITKPGHALCPLAKVHNRVPTLYLTYFFFNAQDEII